MKSNIKCEVIRDLLPLYVENLTSEVTNEEVKMHLEECRECKGVEEVMRKELTNEVKETVEKEIDFLKKVKRKSNNRVVLTGIISAAVLVIILGVLFIKNYVVGEEIDYNYASVNTIEVKQGKLYIAGALSNEKMKVSNVDIEEKNGVVIVKVCEAKKINKRSEEGTRFEMTKNYKNSIKQVYFGDKIVYEDGLEVERYIADIYNKKVQYIGDNSAVNKLEMAMNLGRGEYKIEASELLTVSEPYGIKHIIEVKGAHDSESIKEILIKDSYMLLATVDNLGVVHWEGEIAGEKCEWVINMAEADGEMGKSIKEYGKSAKGLQELYNYLESK